MSQAHAQRLDQQDPLGHFRERFYIADPDLIYLKGNSLGRLPLTTRATLHDLIDNQWGERLIRGWNDGWFTLPNRIGAKVSSLIGARPDEVIVCDSTSVNLFKLVLAALRYRQQADPERTVVVTDTHNFPSDVYIMREGLPWVADNLRLNLVHPQQLPSAFTDEVALVSLALTAFRSSFTHDGAAVTQLAHRTGAWMLWDLSHSVGVMPIKLNEWGVELAVGCTYKYLNGGPGAPAFLYVRRDIQEQLRNPIAGWFGQKNLFTFDWEYESAAGVQRFLAGTPPILSLAAAEGGIDLALEAGIDAIRAKSEQLTNYLIALWEEHLRPLGFTLKSPQNVAQRGAHVAFGHPDAMGINLALIQHKNVLTDFRAPDNIRMGLAPLYTRFVDVYDAVLRTKQVVEEKRYEQVVTPVGPVT